jgi:hypothetical protein
VYLDRNELLLLSRGGRIPRASRHPPVPLPEPERREVRGRLMTAVGRLRGRPARRPALDTHQYLRLEFSVDDERRPTRR